MKTYLTAATIALASIGTMGTAGTISLVSSGPTIALGVGSPVGQNFVSGLQGAGVTDLYTGPMTLTADKPSRVTFTLVGAESGFTNSLLLDGDEIVSEDSITGSTSNFLTGLFNGQLGKNSFAFDFLTGGDLAALLSFESQSDSNLTVDSSDVGFGVFANSADIGNLSVFFLALDDGGHNNDEDYDDVVIRVDVTAVPVPASGLLLIGALGGLAAMRRRKTS